jgi:hypothetical protein
MQDQNDELWKSLYTGTLRVTKNAAGHFILSFSDVYANRQEWNGSAYDAVADYSDISGSAELIITEVAQPD